MHVVIKSFPMFYCGWMIVRYRIILKCCRRLVAGDVNGQVAKLYKRVANIQKKSGDFDVSIASIVDADLWCISGRPSNFIQIR